MFPTRRYFLFLLTSFCGCCMSVLHSMETIWTGRAIFSALAGFKLASSRHKLSSIILHSVLRSWTAHDFWISSFNGHHLCYSNYIVSYNDYTLNRWGGAGLYTLYSRRLQWPHNLLVLPWKFGAIDDILISLSLGYPGKLVVVGGEIGWCTRRPKSKRVGQKQGRVLSLHCIQISFSVTEGTTTCYI